ncbi:MAG: protein tyrosine phosphatase [Chlamydiales bacterium]|jgi:arsenate reductase|nr:protein tyrosine phosphatase [Chlamydiales bacterium]
MKKPFILVICVGNSARSQMAQGFLRKRLGDLARVESGGSLPRGFVDPLAIEVMAEVGIDISNQASKHFREIADGQSADVAITVCHASQCPHISGVKKVLHWEFEDPGHSAQGEALLNSFRSVRDQIDRVFTAYAEGLKEGLRA